MLNFVLSLFGLKLVMQERRSTGAQSIPLVLFIIQVQYSLIFYIASKRVFGKLIVKNSKVRLQVYMHTSSLLFVFALGQILAIA